MTKLSSIVFTVLVVATVGAFFFVQHLKVTTPLIGGTPRAVPSVINPRSNACRGQYRSMKISFYLQHRSDDVDVYVINSSQEIVATLASGVHMQGGAHPVRKHFAWWGVQDDGSDAPDGTYFVRVDLRHQGRSVVIAAPGGGAPLPVKVKTRSPSPVITSVTPHLVPVSGAMKVAIGYAGTQGHAATVNIYRTDLAGGPKLVKSFVSLSVNHAVWDGTIDKRPAPAGTYLVGLDVTDAACNTGRFPAGLPPAPGSTAHAGVTVRNLTAAPPLTPVSPGAVASVNVDSRSLPYDWELRRAGSGNWVAAVGPSGSGSLVPPGKPLEHGHATTYALSVGVPRGGPALYALSLRSTLGSTTVPLVASPGASSPPGVASASKPAPVLVVLPALSWQGSNPGDEDGDGMPDVLGAGASSSVQLNRPFAHGLPDGFADEAALLDFLSRSHLAFDLTTDLALIQGVGPTLSGHRGVILAGSERWITPALTSALRSYVNGGGSLLSLGLQSLRSQVTVSGLGGASASASRPTPLAPMDAFGVMHGDTVLSTGGNSILSIVDGLGLFGKTSGVFPGFSAFEPITGVQSPAQLLSSAGTSSSAVSVAGVRLGNGTVVEVALPGFASALDVPDAKGHPPSPATLNARELFAGAWALLTAGH